MEQVTAIQYIPMWMVNVSPMNPRKTFDQASLEELADNIKRQGLLQPITVRPVDYRDELTDGEVVSIPSKYEIVCGERRYRAVKLNGDETIPCIVRDMSDEEAFDAMITENLQRKDVDPIEEAFAFAQLYARGKGVEEMKPGKMVLAHSDNYYGKGDDYQDLKQYCIGQGYMLVSADMFERWQNLKIDDEATRQKLDAGEAYLVLLIDSDYRGVRVEEKCFAVRQEESKNTAEASAVAQLVRNYKSNIEASKGSVASAMRQAVSDYDINAISWKALTNVEWEILMTLLINTAPYNVRYEILGSTHAKETDYAKEHNTGEGRDDVIRRWLRGKLSDSGVIYNPVLQECQERLVEVWGIDDVEVKAKAAAKLRKKQEKIEKALTKLGYDTEGKKLAF